MRKRAIAQIRLLHRAKKSSQSYGTCPHWEKRKKRATAQEKAALPSQKNEASPMGHVLSPLGKEGGKKKEQSHSSRKGRSTEQKNLANPMEHVPIGKRKTKKENKKEP